MNIPLDQSSIGADTLQAYRETHYRVQGRRLGLAPFVLQAGQRSQPCSDADAMAQLIALR
jgi:hypothetical protein